MGHGAIEIRAASLAVPQNRGGSWGEHGRRNGAEIFNVKAIK